MAPQKFSHILCSLQPNGLPSALEQNDPDNYPQQYRWFLQRCGNDVLNMQSPKGDEDVHETSSLQRGVFGFGEEYTRGSTWPLEHPRNGKKSTLPNPEQDFL